MTATSATLKHANGVTHPTAPLSLELQPRGPVGSWPRTRVPEPPAGARLLPLVALPSHAPAAAATHDGDTTAGGTAPPAGVPEERLLRSALRALSRLRAPSADTVITWAMAATVALVVVDAAIVSYSHIYGLATWKPGTGAETGIQARLLPLSIDGVIAEASLVKLYAARHQVIRKTKLATFMLSLGIVATVAANVTHGLPTALLSPVWHTVIMALMSAWPAGAFIGSVEMAMGLVRNKRAIAEGDADGDSGDGEDEAAPPPPPPPPPPSPRPRRPKRPAHDTVADTIKRHPGWDNDTVAKHCGVSVRTVERRRKAATPAAP